MSGKKRKAVVGVDMDDDISGAARNPGETVAEADSGSEDAPQQEEDKFAATRTLFGTDVLVSQIFSYVGMSVAELKELFLLFNTNQFWRGVITPKHVVRPAILEGGYSSTNMKRIAELVSNKKIWAPSAQRLLRLCDARLCESCGENAVRVVSEDYGVLFCKPCIIRATVKVRLGDLDWTFLNEHPLSPFNDDPFETRLAFSKWSEARNTVFIFEHPCSRQLGERVGPTITLEDLRAISAGDGTSMEQIDREDNTEYGKEIVDTHKEMRATEYEMRAAEIEQNARERETLSWRWALPTSP